MLVQKKLLIIGWVWPEPKSSAAGSRMLQLIDFFQRENFDIAFASPAQQTEHMFDLSTRNIRCQAITLNCSSFDTFIETLKPSHVMFDRYMMEEQFGWRVAKCCPNAVRILDTEDLQSLRNARHQAFKSGIPVDQADKHTELAIREVSAILRSDVSIMISQAEIALLTQHYKVDPSLLMYCPFMFDDNTLRQPTPSFDERTGFISIGNFRHAPNWDAVLWLKQHIWPLIRKALPKAELAIYGAYPPKKATDLHDEKSGFLIKGWVDDAELAMRNARVCLAPLCFGAGLKGKLAEAMYCGTPSVTTDIGAEGMQGQQPWGGYIEHSAQAFAEQAIALYQHDALWQQASRNGQINAQQLLQQSIHMDAMSVKLSDISQHLATHRQQNFYGAMLNHHSHRSTQFMSQWIAEKNKHQTVQSHQSSD